MPNSVEIIVNDQNIIIVPQVTQATWATSYGSKNSGQPHEGVGANSLQTQHEKTYKVQHDRACMMAWCALQILGGPHLG